MMEIVLLCLLAYLLGSIPSSVWLGRVVYGKDIREHGSKNAGATNTFRVFGKQLGLIVLTLDIGKGVLAMVLANHYIPSFPSNHLSHDLMSIMAAISCILGHIFPVFVGFKGGKGVATSLGILLGMNPWPTLVCLGIFILVFLFSKFVSLASMSAALSLPIVCYGVFNQYQLLNLGFNLTIASLVIIAHRKNIIRLLKKEEPRMNFGNQKL